MKMPFSYRFDINIIDISTDIEALIFIFKKIQSTIAS